MADAVLMALFWVMTHLHLPLGRAPEEGQYWTSQARSAWSRVLSFLLNLKLLK